MIRPHTHTQGSALVITLMISLVLFISVISITSSLSVSNRRTASDQGVALQAQYAAETGLTRTAESIDTAKQYLSNLQIAPPSNTSDAAAQAAWVAQIKQELYQFCYGDGTGAPVALAAFPVNSDGTPGVGNGQWVCSPSQVTLVDRSKSATEIADARLKLLVNNIAISKYGGAITNLEGAKQYWGNLVKGGSAWTTLGTSNNSTFQSKIAYDLSPSGIQVQGGGFVIQMGNAEVNATGQVVNSGGTVIATRTVAQRRGAGAPLKISLSPPNFAYFAYFYNSHLPADSGVTPTRITSSFSVNGPMFTNGRFVFANGATPQLNGETGSAGCQDGVETNGACTNKMMRYTGYNTTTNVSTNFTPTFKGQWTSLGNSIAPTFAQKKNAGGQFLCLDASNQEYVCTDTDPVSKRARDINWDRSTIPMPNSTTRTNFENLALGGTPQRDASSNLVRNAAGDVQMSTTDPLLSGLFINGGKVAARTETDWQWFGASAWNTAKNPANYTLFSQTSLQNMIGQYTQPMVEVYKSAGKQRIKISANLVRGYAYVVRPDCGGGGGTSGGGTVRNTPNLLRAKLQELGDFVNAIASFGSIAMAQTAPKCPGGTNPSGYYGLWTIDDSCGDYNGQWRLDKSGTATSCSSIPSARDTKTWVSREYEVANDGTITLVSSTTLNNASVGTTTIGLSTAPTSVSGSLISVNKTPTVWVQDNLSKKFNGVIYSDAFDGDDNSNDIWDDDYLAVSGDSGTSYQANADIASYTKLTIASSQNMQIVRDITYTDPPYTTGTPPQPNQNLLGLYAMKNINLEKGRWDTGTGGTNQNLKVNAVVMSQGGSVQTHDGCNTSWNAEGQFQLTGSIIQNRLGAVGCTLTSGTFQGYTSNYTYDTRMQNGFAPPAFPTATTGIWQAQVPNFNDNTTGFFRLTK